MHIVPFLSSEMIFFILQNKKIYKHKLSLKEKKAKAIIMVAGRALEIS